MSDTHVREIHTSTSLDGLQRFAFAAAGIGVVGLGAGFMMNAEAAAQSYLIGYIYWVGIALGCLGLMMVHHLSGGAWGLMIRRPLEAAVSTLPLLAVLFVPIVLGMGHIYEWSHAEEVAKDAILKMKEPYLRPSFFVVRAALYFVIWCAMGLPLVMWSRQQDKTPPAPGEDQLKFRKISGPGLLIFGLTITFASIDWVMSLDPHWYSTIFGLMFMVGSALTALAFTIFVMSLLTKGTGMGDVVVMKNVHDWGKLLLAFTMLWAYLSYSQFLIIYSANLPEEIPWYLRRFANGWQYWSLFLAFGHFFLPFFLLLSRDRKRRLDRLVVVALWMLAARFVDVYWLIGPQFHADSMMPRLTDFAALLGIGGIWLTYFIRQLKGQSLLPVNDPFLKEAIADGHH
ncbi:MAG: hypothetical protein U0Q12_11600 [Vicinamibacterales bacterium]